uniref:Signal recognition particle receptor subunit beta n=1 Tax=Simocephalus serrulatus TaxID=117539 RepID=A0A4Y7NPB2_9CRUS|nr:EOG090X0C7N [Simocephalus serrulatus]SVE94466.1 EOG090X0C7N [Simocephalus serrulatus]
METNEVDDETINEKQRLVSHGEDDDQESEMSKKDETLRSVLDSDEKMSQWGTIVIALIVGFITLAVFLFVWRRGRVSRRGICLVGLCESGKTLIFTQLVYKKALESFTSMKENVGMLEIENKGALKIVDVPGHERVRQRFFDNYKNTARGIVFVLDSFTLTKDIRDVAEYLYTVLSDSVISANRPQILILCNKQDHALAKGPQVIQSLLEKEMNLLRNTKTNQLEAISEGGNQKSYFLGHEGKNFEFADLLPLRVEFAASSAQQVEDLNSLKSWLHTVA